MGPAFALAASLCWGVADFIGGAQARRLSVLSVALISQVTGAVLLTVVVAARSVAPPPGGLIAVGVGTGVLGAFAFYGLYATLAMGNMARVAPVLGTAAAIPVLVGLLSGDDPSSAQLVGIGVAVMGVMFLSVERVGEEQDDSQQHTRRALLLALAIAASIGGTLIGIDRMATYDPFWATLLMRLTGATLLIGWAAALGRAGRFDTSAVTRGAIASLIIVGTLDVAANTFWAVASTEGLLSLVAVLGSVFPAVTVALAVVILRERLDRLQTVGVGLTLSGSAMIAIG